MITQEQLEAAIEDHKFESSKVDELVRALSLLRERIPYNECPRIIEGADHDIVYSCDVEIACKYLEESDIPIVACCMHINDEYLAAFV